MRLIKTQTTESGINNPFWRPILIGLLKGAAALGASLLLHYFITQLGG